MDPLALLLKLNKALDKRAADVDKARAWYSGAHPAPDPPPDTTAAVDDEAKRAFEKMARLSVMNFLGTVADVKSEALAIEGFRFSTAPTSSDSEAWTIWQRNHLDGDSDLGIEAALRTGQAFALVWADGDGLAEITIEDPSQCIVLYEAGSRRRRAAGLKRWVDDDGRTMATLYTPGAIYKFQSTWVASTSGLVLPQPTDKFEPREIPGETWPLPNPLGKVPLIELRVNAGLKPSSLGGGRPEFAAQITDQKRINNTVMQLLVTMDYQSFRQRWVTGWDYPTLDDGRPDKRALMRASAARLWAFNDEEAVNSSGIKVGEFAQAEFQPFLSAVEMWVKAIASSSGTPPYAFLLGDMINVAADSLARIEGIKVRKLGHLARTLGESFEEVIRLALEVESNPKAADMSSSVIWAEFEERTATEQANLAQIFRQLGAPDEIVYATLPGVDQAEAARWVRQNTAAELMAGTAGADPNADLTKLKIAAEALGQLIRAGVEPANAATQVGLTGVEFTDLIPASLKTPDEFTPPPPTNTPEQ